MVCCTSLSLWIVPVCFSSINFISVWECQKKHIQIYDCVYAGIQNGIKYFSTVIGTGYSAACNSIITWSHIPRVNEMWLERLCLLFSGSEPGLISFWTLRTSWYGLCMAWWLNMMSDTNMTSLINGGEFYFLWVRLNCLYTCAFIAHVIWDTLDINGKESNLIKIQISIYISTQSLCLFVEIFFNQIWKKGPYNQNIIMLNSFKFSICTIFDH